MVKSVLLYLPVILKVSIIDNSVLLYLPVIPVGSIIVKSVMRRLACLRSAMYAAPQVSWNLDNRNEKKHL